MPTKKSQPNQGTPARTSLDAPAEPAREGLEQTWSDQHPGLYDGVKMALHAIADGFDADIEISAIRITRLKMG